MKGTFEHEAYILSLIHIIELDSSDSVPLNMEKGLFKDLSVKGSSLSLTAPSHTWPPLSVFQLCR